MDLTFAVASVQETTTQAANATTKAANASAKSGPISNETFGLWFVLLLILGVLLFLFWGE